MQHKKPSVVQIIDRLNAGGAERVLVTIANMLHRKGHWVKVITTVSGGPLVQQLDKEIPYINLARKWKWNVLTMRRLVKELKDFDIIHVHSVHNLRYVYLAAQLFRLKKPIFFHEHHGARAETAPKPIEKFIAGNITFIAVSKQLKAWAIEKLRVSSTKVFLLSNTVLKENVPTEKKDNDERTKLVVVSNFVPIKNIEYAITIFTDLIKTGKKFHLTIVGSIFDIGYYNQIKLLIDNLRLPSQIQLITACNNIQPMLNQFDFALHTSKSESGPLVLIEYMAQGLPFLSYNTGEVVEEIKNKIPLAVMNSFDKQEWLKRIETMLNLPQDDLKNKFANVYAHYFSIDQYYEKLLHIYETAI